MKGNEVLQGEFYILIRIQREDVDAGKSFRTVFYLCWEAEARAPAMSLWCLFRIPLSRGLQHPQKHHIGSKFPHCDIGRILQI